MMGVLSLIGGIFSIVIVLLLCLFGLALVYGLIVDTIYKIKHRCHKCGTPLGKDDNYCKNCGEEHK